MNRAVVFAMAVAGASVGSLACSSAFAQSADQNDSGFYIGGGVGQFNVKIDDVDQTDEAIQRLDDSDTSWKAFVGWRMSLLKSRRTAVHLVTVLEDMRRCRHQRAAVSRRPAPTSDRGDRALQFR